MTGWMWIALGLVLAAIELATPGGFFIIFFGVGAVVVGLLQRGRAAGAGVGAVAASSPSSPWRRCASSGSRSWPGCRPRQRPRRGFARRRHGPARRTRCEAGGHGKAEVRGAVWNARNVSEPRRGGAGTLPRRRRQRPGTRHPDRSEVTVEATVVVLILVALLILLRPLQDGGGRAAAERVRRRAPGPLPRHAQRRLPHPGAVRGRHPLPALAQGAGARHSGAGLHHPRQRAGGRGRHPVPEGAEPGARVLRHLELPLRHHAAGADHAAQRGRQDRPRPHVRGTRQHQPRGGRRAGQGRRKPGASRCCATRSRTSSRRRTSWRRWKSRCAPSARSAR